jgi:hypothetical protein
MSGHIGKMSGHNESVATLSKFRICREIFGGKFRPGENVGDISDISDISAIYSTVVKCCVDVFGQPIPLPNQI